MAETVSGKPQPLRRTPLSVAVLMVVSVFFPALGRLQAAEGTPYLKLSRTAADFGKCGHRQRLTKKVILANEGTAPLTVSSLRKSCDCTSLALDGKPLPRTGSTRFTIPPGEEVELDITLSTGRVMGILHKYVEIVSNDPRRPRIRIPVIARVHDDVKAIPWTLPQFTAVAGGKPVTQEFLLLWLEKPGSEPPLENLRGQHANVRPTARKLTEKELKKEFEEYRARHPYVNAYGRYRAFYAGYRITVEITPPPTEQFFSSKITALVNGRYWEFPVRGYAFAGIMVEPRYFQFGGIEDPATLSRTVELRSVDDRRFEILGIECRPDILSFEIKSAPDRKKYRVTARIKTRDRTQRFFARVKIRTDHPKKPLITLTCLGFWKKAARGGSQRKGGSLRSPRSKR